MRNFETHFEKDFDNHIISITRKFAASRQRVWDAWTQPAILDNWWAPRPWKTNTVSMDLKDGGKWLYYMQGPDGTKSYCVVTFKKVHPIDTFSSNDAFCDEQGNINDDFPAMDWDVTFSEDGNDATEVSVHIKFGSRADMEKIIEMGFSEGFTMANGNLDELLA